jgi:hypothetical protein
MSTVVHFQCSLQVLLSLSCVPESLRGSQVKILVCPQAVYHAMGKSFIHKVFLLLMQSPRPVLSPGD